MPEGMTYEKMKDAGFHNSYDEEPDEIGEYECMCKKGHMHVLEYRGSHIWSIPDRCGWSCNWWRKI